MKPKAPVKRHTKEDIEWVSERIFKECFWGDYDMDKNDIIYIIENPYENMQKTKLLLSKILYNGNDFLYYFSFFPREMLREYIYNKKVGGYREKEVRKRIDMVKVYFFGEDIYIKGLTWGKRKTT